MKSSQLPNLRDKLLFHEVFANEFDKFLMQKNEFCWHQSSRNDKEICAAIPMLSSGAAVDSWVDYVRISEHLFFTAWSFYGNS